ncbi:MAG: DUF3828 domain-containing protein [Caulobacteraceae bacterium]
MIGRASLLAAGLALALPANGSPDAFVRGLYAPYRADSSYSSLGQAAGGIYTPALLALMDKDQRAHPGEVGAIDGDPVCDCQDSGTIRVVQATYAARAGGVRATVRFVNLGETRTVGLDLVRATTGWRVDDVHDPGQASLRTELRRSIAGR